MDRSLISPSAYTSGNRRSPVFKKLLRTLSFRYRLWLGQRRIMAEIRYANRRYDRRLCEILPRRISNRFIRKKIAELSKITGVKSLAPEGYWKFRRLCNDIRYECRYDHFNEDLVTYLRAEGRLSLSRIAPSRLPALRQWVKE